MISRCTVSDRAETPTQDLLTWKLYLLQKFYLNSRQYIHTNLQIAAKVHHNKKISQACNSSHPFLRVVTHLLVIFYFYRHLTVPHYVCENTSYMLSCIFKLCVAENFFHTNRYSYLIYCRRYHIIPMILYIIIFLRDI